MIGIGLLCVVAVLINGAFTYYGFQYLSGIVAEDREVMLKMRTTMKAACLALADQTKELGEVLSSPPAITVGPGELLKAYHPDDAEEAEHLMTIYRERGLLPGVAGTGEDFEDGRGF